MKRRFQKNKNDYLSFEESKEFVRALGLRSQKEWERYSKTERPSNIVSSPSRTYKNKGWIGWADWLGTKNHAYWPSRKKYKVNDDFFKVWSHDMAYILGFWWADGWISKNRFCLIQHKKDKYILEKIMNIIGYDGKLYNNKYNNCYTLEISSSEIIKDIKKLGGLENKSLTIKFPEIPIKYRYDFIRGLFDGDGCITYNKNKKCYLASYVSGSKDFAYSLMRILKSEIKDIHVCIYEVSKNRKNILYSLMLSKNNTIMFKRYIYRDYSELKLIRKWELFQKVGEICIFGSYRKVYLPYNDAVKIVSKIGLRDVKEWRVYSKTIRPKNIPSTPLMYYKNKGWTNWYDWLGKQNKKKGK